MKILLLPKYFPEGASSRYRTHNYIDYFIKNGHEVTIKPLFYDGYVKNLYQKKSKDYPRILSDILNRAKHLLKNKSKYDIIIIEKELFPYFPYIFERILLQNSRYTLDYDDAVSTKYKGGIIKKVLGDKINNLSENALATAVGNRWYWEEITKGNLVYLPTVVDLNKYPIKGIKKPVNYIPIISWIGSPSTVKYIYRIKSVLVELIKVCQFKLRVIGGNIDIEGLNIECLPWCEDKEFEHLFSSDIGIMPLHETPWEYGKCGFKCIQYMASGLPVVASALPANEEIIIHGETGFIAKDDNEWYEYLKLLLTEPNKRISYGGKARMRVEKNYSYQVWGSKYIEHIENLSI
ncbi:glycosyltransferase family 4 protein [Alkaliphilus peptidifermentans]|uniref:Glycosyltransferase involved in cell wall bisynthesis n=1 Tax=Alkaliphilus peptidifermentans DSM 18978 TaxID=1120976 RepID=A0A1G5AHB2_9FIRM|nr:glycosyltransferase family 4 protein [Alkaliphilus peptidifermentans]SCX77294.1 Glycosyltransferase involved in cell wall bisynthesis [Alkaliphilus peptidifermentans DSM 18978]